MRYLWSAFSFLLLLALPLSAAENTVLAKLDRTPPKLPPLHSKHPEYCLLVFGPDAHKHVWLVQDGDVLYVDRQGNGDLTDPDDRVSATTDNGDPKDGAYEFKVGDIPDGTLTHKDLRVYRQRLDFLQDGDPRVRAFLLLNPQWRGCSVQIDVEIPGQHGGGIEGRVVEAARTQDEHGYLQFGARPELAPVINFGAAWQITFYNPEPWWHIDSAERVYLAVGTPGMGSGTTAFVDYQGVIPTELHPTLKVSCPPAEKDQSPIEKSYELTQRCCGINLYGSIKVPAEVGTGTAKVEISLPPMQGIAVASTNHTVFIIPAKPKPELKLEPISGRFKRSLPHVSEKEKTNTIVEVQFSPDAKRLIAGDYPGGIVNMWDIETGKRLLTLDTGEGYRSSYRYFVVSPDWKLIYAPTCKKDRKFEKITKDSKSLMRWSFNDSVRVFDLDSGKLLRTLQHSPPREISSIDLSSDGLYLLSSDGTPGDYEGSYRQALSLWNTQTNAEQELVDSYRGLSLLSPDGKQVAVSISSTENDGSYDKSIKIFDIPDVRQRATIVLPSGLVTAWPCEFCSDGKVLVARVEVYEHRGDQHGTTMLKCYEISTGKEIFSMQAGDDDSSYYPVKISPDRHILIAVERNSKTEHSRLCLVNLDQFEVRHLEFPEGIFVADVAFHNSGKWLAAATMRLPKDLQPGNEPPPEELPQPRIHIVDTSTAKIMEMLISPQCYPISLAFSPDGNTLATSGHGEVLLWDFATPPSAALH